MPKEIFFNSSMPRAGSTLLSNILGNNPDIYATPTSGLCDLLYNSKKIYTQLPAFLAQDSELMKSAYLHYCRYAMHGYFEPLTDRKYVLDKSRGWAVNRSFLAAFYPNPKIVCMVRDLREIVASMEGNFRKNPDKWDIVHEKEYITVGDRVSFWLNPISKPVGASLKFMYDIVHNGSHKDILFIKYEDLTENPQREIKKVHEYFELPNFNYDFKNIQQVTYEDDKYCGIYGDHVIKTEVKPLFPKSYDLLGSEICNKIYNYNKWYFDFFEYKK